MIRLERECFGEAKLSGPRRCQVRIGEPINLNGRWEAYAADRRGEVQRTAREVERRVADLLVIPPHPMAQDKEASS